jgi:hypothetical protein
MWRRSTAYGLSEVREKRERERERERETAERRRENREQTETEGDFSLRPSPSLFLSVDSDQASVAPNIIITSAYWVWGPMLLHYVDGIRSGQWPSEFIYWGFREVLERVEGKRIEEKRRAQK